MKIDSCLILSAGLGTRMGPIGKILPKPLWPLFEKKILEVQISFAQSLGINKIFVNGHHCSDQLRIFLEQINQKKSQKINFLHEEELLGSGGGVHNLAEKESYKGNLLYLAGDQFYIFDKKYLEKSVEELSTNHSILFGLTVKKSEIYNRLILENNYLKNIEGPNSNSPVTFSGMGLINLNKLTPVKGISSFFDTIANYKENKIKVITPPKAEYWDFGTSKNYFDSCFRLLDSTESKFLEFCKKDNVFDLKIKKSDAYGVNSGKNLINLTKKKVINPQNQKAIVMEIQNDELEVKFPGIYLNEISERIT